MARPTRFSLQQQQQHQSVALSSLPTKFQQKRLSPSTVYTISRGNPLFVVSPFELSTYPDEEELHHYWDKSPLACPNNQTKLVIGLNKYSHDASLFAADAETGNVLFALSKERLTRQKHDGGNTAELVQTCLDALNLNVQNIQTVVMNNHHHRIMPLIEKDVDHMEWEAALSINGGEEIGYTEDENLLQTGNSNLPVLDEHDNDMESSASSTSTTTTTTTTTSIQKLELSHHLAHAYSTAAQAPFESGMVVVMDGMGDTYRTMLNAKANNDTSYVSDLSFPIPQQQQQQQQQDNGFAFQCIPSDLAQQSQTSLFDWREAESVYVFQKCRNTTTNNNKKSDSHTPRATMMLRPVFKRFIPECTPPALFNHGFENMQSLGAIYSRASTHIFGNWNVCGKVMGMAPWIGGEWTKKGETIQPKVLRQHTKPIFWGSLYSEEPDKKFQYDKKPLSGMPYFSRMDDDLLDDQGEMIRPNKYDFDYGTFDQEEPEERTNPKPYFDDTGKIFPTQVALDAISLSHRVQMDLEHVVLDFVKHFKETTGEQNLCIAGGVGLNSVLNGRLSRELGFKNTFLSPYPGDDGIAAGCCAFGLFGNTELEAESEIIKSKEGSWKRPLAWKSPLSPFLGPVALEAEIKTAIRDMKPWIEFETIRSELLLLDTVVRELDAGGVVAWYQGRSEMGPRALGNRSILADPRQKGFVRHINQNVKTRELFRPLGSSVLAELANEWFDLGTTPPTKDNNISPFMSLTAQVKEDKRALIPAVTHVDGSSRLQTVTHEFNPLFYRLIARFYKLTGVPIVLNTSFNTFPGEPIVETPKDAIQSFLYGMGAIDMLVIGEYVIKRKDPNLRSLLGALNSKGDALVEIPSCPRRTGPVTFQTTFQAQQGAMNPESIRTSTKVRMPSRPLHREGDEEWVELLDELEGEVLSVCDGSNTLNDILARYTMMEKKEETTPEKLEEAQSIAENIVHRLVRMYEQTLISW